MKTMIAVIAVIFSIATQAQDVIDKKRTPDQRKQELLNFINSDEDLQGEYKSGMRNVSTAKRWGIASLGFLALGVGVRMSANNNRKSSDGLGDIANAFGPILIVTLGACVTGTVGIKLRSKGKSKIRDVMNFAQYKVNKDYGGGLDIQTTSNGLGFVYSF